MQQLIVILSGTSNAISALKQARLAQSVEHETLNLRVVGSSPTLGEFFFKFGKIEKKSNFLMTLYRIGKS